MWENAAVDKMPKPPLSRPDYGGLVTRTVTLFAYSSVTFVFSALPHSDQ